MVFWGRKYALKAKAEREEVLIKAHDLAANPQKYTKATSYGAAKYVNNLKFDKKTGEILNVKEHPVFVAAKVAEEEKYDGYYAIVTSGLDMSDAEIIETYRGLWKIEETFRVTIVECLNRISCSNEHENIYLFDYRSEISDAIGEALGIDFTNKRLRLGDIKKILAQAKKKSFSTTYL